MRLHLVVAACLVASSAAAQQQCRPLDEMQKMLKDRYAERPIGGGFVNPGIAVSVFASIDGKTFTVLSITKQGMACLLASGTDFDPGILPRVEG